MGVRYENLLNLSHLNTTLLHLALCGFSAVKQPNVAAKSQCER